MKIKLRLDSRRVGVLGARPRRRPGLGGSAKRSLAPELTAMGGAYTGVADDISSLIYNPAGLTSNTFEIALGVGSTNLAGLSKFQEILSEEFDEELNLNLITLGGMSLGRFGAGVAADGSAVVEEDCAGGRPSAPKPIT